ncbi:hypothetical protein [Kitasatospora sp. McL0602]|uniref:hypothetical protein n=1 Tax=Kitasatospora sp. McL0602 TaxID=3439530 RepID=UPI003F8A0CA2
MKPRPGPRSGSSGWLKVAFWLFLWPFAIPYYLCRHLYRSAKTRHLAVPAAIAWAGLMVIIASIGSATPSRSTVDVYTACVSSSYRTAFSYRVLTPAGPTFPKAPRPVPAPWPRAGPGGLLLSFRTLRGTLNA